MNRIIYFLMCFTLFVGVYFITALSWTGAEYIFETSVHMGTVNRVVCGILAALTAYYIVKRFR